MSLTDRSPARGGRFPRQAQAEPAKLAGQILPGEGDRKQRSERDHRVDRLAPLTRPVVVGEVEPERELVECECRARPVDKRGRARGERASGPDPDLVQPGIPDPEEPDDPEGHVVDVAAARRHVPKRSATGPDRVGDQPRHPEGGPEAQRADQPPLLLRAPE